MRAPGQAGVTWYPLPYVSFLLVTLVFRDCLPPERLTRAEIRRKQAERDDAEAV